MLQDVGGGADPVGKGDHAHAVFHHAGLVAHADAPDTGDAGEPLLQLRHMGLELRVV